jgi:hypothetical protein
MSFKQLTDESIVEAWERYQLFVAHLLDAGMEDWDFTQGFYYGLSQEAKEHIDNLAGGTTTERESEEYAKDNSHATKIDHLTQKFQGLDLNQASASKQHRAEQEFQPQPSNEKKRPIFSISSDAILDKLQNRLSGPGLPTVPCILGPFKVHDALCDWGASTNILPKMIYDCLDEDPLVPTSQQL